MNNKLDSFGIILLIIIAGFLGFVTFWSDNVNAAGITIYVDDDNTSGTEDGTLAFPYNTITEGVAAAGNGDTVFVFNGTYPEHVVISNTINLTGAGRDNTTIDGGGSGDVINVSANFVNITGFTLKGAGPNFDNYGLLLSSVRNCYITHMNISSNLCWGLYLDNSDNNTISNNLATGHPWSGIHIQRSKDNSIHNNTVSNNKFGIWVSYSDNNTISNNSATSNTDDGIYLSHSNNNTVMNNTAQSNNHGISLGHAYNNTVIYNNILLNPGEGFDNFYSDKNKIHHNNIINNGWNSDDGNNEWDNGYPSGGNYWSKYTGIDEKSGPNQDEPGSDDIGDTAYNIAGGSNRDKYPLMYPLGFPTEPQNIQAVSGNQTINLSWDPPISDGGFPITNYKIYRRNNSGGESLLAIIGNITNYIDINLTNGKTYYYKVRAVNSFGEGFLSDELSATPATIPSAPTGLIIFTGDSYVNISWNAPVSNGGSPITNYIIYRGMSSGNVSFLIEIGNITYYNDTIVINGITYYYNISAKNGAGESPLSNETYGTPLGLPSEPMNLQTFWGDSFINITWDAPTLDGGTPVINYRIYRGTISGGESFLDEIGNVLFYNDTNVINGITYFYRVSAVNIIGEGSLSNEVYATPITVSTEPLDLSATAGDSYVDITWDEPISNGGAPISNYRIYRGTTSGDVALFNEIGNITFYNDTTVMNGITYYYNISAVNVAGEGALSNETIGTPLGSPSEPINLLTFWGDSYINITWDAPTLSGGTPITNYIIYRGTISGGETFLTEIGNLSYHNDTGVTNGINYFYKVSAKNIVGEGPLSVEVTANPATVPTEPLNSAAWAGDSYINVSWDSPTSNGGSQIINYLIYKGTISGSEIFLVEIGNVSYYVDTMVTNGITYYYKVSAKNDIGEGSLSNEVYGTPMGLPSSPQNLQASSGDSFVNISWIAPILDGGTPVTNYRIYRGPTSGDVTFYIEIGNVTFYNDTNVTNGVIYYYEVAAKNIVGEGGLSNETQSSPSTFPDEPILVNVICGDSYVNLIWDPPISDGGFPITNYRVYRGNTSGGEIFLIEIGNISSYNDTSVTNGITYYYKVSAKNIVGEGALSEETSKIPLGLPTAPQNIQSSSGDSYVNISWDPPNTDGGTPITNFILYRGNISGEVIFYINIDNVYFFNDTNVINGNTYYYKLSAINNIGEGKLSEEVFNTPGVVPSAPINVSASVGISFINITWEKPFSNGGFPIINYLIYKGDFSGGETFYMEIGNILFFNDTYVPKESFYYYKIRAKNTLGEGAESEEIQSKLIGPPSEPINFKAFGGVSYILLTWASPIFDGGSPVTNFTIYRGTKSGFEFFYNITENVSYFNDTLVTNGTTYYYLVSAINIAGEGLSSNETNAKPISVPSSPRDLHTMAGDQYVNLTWSVPSSNGSSIISNYIIYRSEIKGEETYYLKIGSVLSYNDTNVTNGVVYYYRVSANNVAGESPLSKEVSAIPATYPSQPQNLAAFTGDNYVNLIWDVPSSDGGHPIMNYKIYRGMAVGGETYLTTIDVVQYFNDTPVTNGQTYYYRVSAVNEVGEGQWSIDIYVTPINLSDIDQDNLPDSWEQSYFGDLNQEPDNDYDGDGYTNLQEYLGDSDPTDGKDYPGVKKQEESESIFSLYWWIFIIIAILIVIIIVTFILYKKSIDKDDEEIVAFEVLPDEEIEKSESVEDVIELTEIFLEENKL
jgi:parallel beta-helix repeat protein